jgi:parallel beta-helix repeat protein
MFINDKYFRYIPYSILITLLLLSFIVSHAQVGYWKGNNDATDDYGVNDGTLTGGLYTTSREEGSHAFNLNITGTNRLSVGVLDLGNEFSISVRFSSDDNGNAVATIASNLVSNDGFELWFDGGYSNSKRLYFKTGNGILTDTAYSDEIGYFGGSFKTITIIANKTAGTVVFYVEGTDVTSNNGTRTDYETNSNILFGNNTIFNRAVYGILDDIQLYNCLLTGTQVSSINSTPGDLQTCSTGGGSGSIFYIHPDSTYTTIDDLENIVSSGDTILGFSGYKDRIDGFYLNGKTIYIGTYGGTEPYEITGYYDVSGSFTQSGNVWYKTISSMNSIESMTMTHSYTWETYWWRQINSLNFLLIDGEKKTIGRYPDYSYLTIEVDEIASPSYTGFTDNELTGFPSNHWLGSHLLLHNVDWVNQKILIEVTESNGYFGINNDIWYWNGEYYLDWAFDNNKYRIPYIILNHPNTLSLNGEWSFYFPIERLYIYDTENLNGKTIELSLYDSVLYFTNCDLTMLNVKVTGGNKYTVGLENTNTVIDSCKFIYGGSMAAIGSTESYSIKIFNSTFEDCAGGAIEMGSDNADVDIQNNNFNRIGIWLGMGTGILNTPHYTCITDHAFNGGSFKVINNRVDSVGAFYSQRYFSEGGRLNHDTLIINKNLVTNGGRYFNDWGDTYNFAGVSNYTEIKKNGFFGNMLDQNWMMEPLFHDYHGIYQDGYADSARIDSNTIALKDAYGIKLHGTKANQVTNNKLFYNGYGDIYLTELGHDGYTNYARITGNVMSPKNTNYTGIFYNRDSSTVHTYNNVVDSNRYLNWNGADDNVWTITTNWESETEWSLAQIAAAPSAGYGFEINSTQSNTGYDSAIIIYNWTDVDRVVKFTGYGFDEDGSALAGDSVVIEPFYSQIVRFNSSFTITNDNYEIMPGVVLIVSSNDAEIYEGGGQVINNGTYKGILYSGFQYKGIIYKLLK